MVKVYKFISRIILLQDVFIRSFIVVILTFIDLPIALLIFPLFALVKGLMSFRDFIIQVIKNETNYLIDSYKKQENINNADI